LLAKKGFGEAVTSIARRLLRSRIPWRDMPLCLGPWRHLITASGSGETGGIFNQMLKRLHLKLNDQ